LRLPVAIGAKAREAGKIAGVYAFDAQKAKAFFDAGLHACCRRLGCDGAKDGGRDWRRPSPNTLKTRRKRRPTCFHGPPERVCLMICEVSLFKPSDWLKTKVTHGPFQPAEVD
jgi:hypothetical protein